MREQEIFNMYGNKKIYENEFCKQCKQNNEGLTCPVGIWQYGEQFDNSKYKIMFVGKTAVTDNDMDKEEYEKESFAPYTISADKLYSEGYSHIWTYVREISKRLYGDDEWEKIAFTNLIKCNKGQNEDSTTQDMKNHCCLENKFIIEEIKIVKPKYIIFMVGNYYKDVVFRLLMEEYRDSIDVNNINNECSIGLKKMPYYEMSFTNNGERVNCLFIGHPERMQKEDYVQTVVDFIKK